MIEFMSMWAEQIVLAVIIATIIELILPSNKNKKYIQMVIGIYILFNIISPVIKNKEVFNFEEYTIDENTIKSEYEIDQSSMDKRLEKIYLEELENDIKNRFESKGFSIVKCKIDAELNTTKKNAGIHLITVKIKGPVNELEVAKIKTDLITEYEIEENKINVTIK